MSIISFMHKRPIILLLVWLQLLLWPLHGLSHDIADEPMSAEAEICELCQQFQDSDSAAPPAAVDGTSLVGQATARMYSTSQSVAQFSHYQSRAPPAV